MQSVKTRSKSVQGMTRQERNNYNLLAENIKLKQADDFLQTHNSFRVKQKDEDVINFTQTHLKSQEKYNVVIDCQSVCNQWDIQQYTLPFEVQKDMNLTTKQIESFKRDNLIGKQIKKNIMKTGQERNSIPFRRCVGSKYTQVPFSFKQPNSDLNHLVENQPENQDQQQKLYECMQPNEKTFDPQLSLDQDDRGLKSVLQRRQEVFALKENLAKFQEWKKNFLKISKANRLFSEYKSGILGIDNPLNQNTLIYKNKREESMQKQQETSQIQTRQKQFLYNQNLVAENITFYNIDKYVRAQSTEKPRKTVAKKQKTTINPQLDDQRPTSIFNKSYKNTLMSHMNKTNQNTNFLNGSKIEIPQLR